MTQSAIHKPDPSPEATSASESVSVLISSSTINNSIKPPSSASPAPPVLPKLTRIQCVRPHLRSYAFFSKEDPSPPAQNPQSSSHVTTASSATATSSTTTNSISSPSAASACTSFNTDIPLGGLVTLLCSSANERCEHRLECEHLVGAHEWEWIHGGVAVRGDLVLRSSFGGSAATEDQTEKEIIMVWNGCAMCNRTSVPKVMSEAAR
jgi:hypothetical protein